MRLLNLFDGIGGFALAAEWMGWENVGSVEIDPFCRQVLDYWFDYECTWTDIKAADFVRLHRRIDIITGGFPCQPFSNAGKQRGKDDDRYLWPEMLRAIREVQPRWVVGENVRGLLSNAGGMVFEQVCADMETLGYEVQPLLVPACAVDAPHRRDRVWIVARLAANTPRNGDSGTSSEAGATPRRPDGNEAEQPLQRGGFRAAPDTDSDRFGKRKGEQKPFARSCGETHDSDGGKDGFAADTDRDGRQAETQRESGEGCETSHQPESLQHPGIVPHPVGDRHSAPGAGEGAEGGGRGHVLQPEERGDEAERADGLPRLPRADSDSYGQIGWEGQPRTGKTGKAGFRTEAFGCPPDWSRFPTQSPVCGGDDGIPTSLFNQAFYKGNRMDKLGLISQCLREGRLATDPLTGEIYSYSIRGKEGEKTLLNGSLCNGYIVHSLRYRGIRTQVKAHQVIWVSVNGTYDNEIFQIDHINRDRTDNRISNLRLVTAKENIENSERYKGRFSEEEKERIAILSMVSDMSNSEIAEIFGCSKSRIQQIASEYKLSSALAGITFPRWRREALKCFGNSIVPQVALEIFKAIEKTENELNNH